MPHRTGSWAAMLDRYLGMDEAKTNVGTSIALTSSSHATRVSSQPGDVRFLTWLLVKQQIRVKFQNVSKHTRRENAWVTWS